MKTRTSWLGQLIVFSVLAMAMTMAPMAPLQAAAPVPGADVAGTWQGTIEVPGAKLRIAVHVEHAADGALAGTLDSIDQGARGMKIDAIGVTGNTLTFTINAISGRYSGDIAADGQTITGTWSQGTASLPLNLRRDAVMPVVRRPQEPVRPLPYTELEVFYDSDPGVRLAATLTLPAGKGPFPAVVLITGSGAQDRDEALSGHRPFHVLADALTRRGIVVLRADDRGVGKSTGNYYASTTSLEFAHDALAGVRHLLQRPEVDTRRIGLMGHSEGGLVAPLAVTSGMPDADRVAFLVLLAGPGVPLGEILIAQQRWLLNAQGIPASYIEVASAHQQRLQDIARTEPDEQKAAAALRTAITEYATTLPEPYRTQATSQAEAQVAQLNSAWMRWMLRYDPAATLAKIRLPVLALFGGKDMQVPASQNRAPLEAALQANHAAGTAVIEYPSLNHLFQTAQTGSPNEYAQIEETMNPTVLQKVGDWVLARGATP